MAPCRGLIISCAVAAVSVALWPHVGALASDCSVTSVNLTPINDLGGGLYLGQYPGGLYPDGQNIPPAPHASVGLARARAIQPRGPDGQPAPDGKYVMVSIGMSNTTQEFCSQPGTEPCNPWTFMGQAAMHPDVDTTHMAIVNGARGGQAASSWESPSHQNYNRIRDQVLAPKGLTEAQVQVVWVKVANPQPQVSLPSAAADAFDLLGRMGNIVRTLNVRYPNVQQVYLSSRIYAGYASTTLNPEPYAYESAFAVKWLIEAQIDQAAGGGADPIAGDLSYGTVAPWLAWCAYPWADGFVPRSDGLIWLCSDLEGDGTHPATTGEEKVGTLLLDFFLDSPFSRPWFVRAGGLVPGDVNGDGLVDIQDLLQLLAAWGPCAGCPEDLDDDGDVDINDLLMLLANWT